MSKRILLQRVNYADSTYPLTAVENNIYKTDFPYKDLEANDTTYEFSGDLEFVLSGNTIKYDNEDYELDKFSSLKNIEGLGKFPLLVKDSQLNRELLVGLLREDSNSDDTASEIERIEEELASQKGVDKLKKDLKSKEEELDSMSKLMKSVENLTVKLKDSESKLSQLMQLGVSSDQEVEQMKEEILINMQNKLRDNGKPTISKAVDAVKTHFNKMPIWPPMIWASLSFFIALVLALRFMSLNLILAGTFFAIIQFLLILILVAENNSLEFQIVDKDSMLTNNKIDGINDLIAPSNIVKDNSKGAYEAIEDLFSRNALKDAYEEDINRLHKTINKHLEGKEYHLLESDYKKLEADVEMIKKELDEKKKSVLTPDQYLKKRRELDMLKMKLKRGNSNVQESSDSIIKYIKKRSSLVDINLKSTVQEILMTQGAVRSIEVKEGNLLIDDQISTSEQLSGINYLDLITRLIFKVSIGIKEKSLAMLPLFFVSDNFSITDEIRQLSDLRQIILIK